MAQKHRTRPDQGRVGCDRLPGASRLTVTRIALQAQFLADLCGLRPEFVVTLASLIFGGMAETTDDRLEKACRREIARKALETGVR